MQNHSPSSLNPGQAVVIGRHRDSFLLRHQPPPPFSLKPLITPPFLCWFYFVLKDAPNACKVFDDSPVRDCVSYNTMINGLVRVGRVDCYPLVRPWRIVELGE
ncbi:hypothetical protein V8G54_030595 [Vigna mungo]|uniref:Uncharacterized protein n=1 Tax=Vigna mungo TaxID=3915 RepID=A0AAQ3MXC4_VIGMU